MSIEKRLALHIKELRAQKGITQIELAELSAIEYKHIQALESTKSNHSPTLRTLVKLSNAFDMELWKFLKSISTKENLK